MTEAPRRDPRIPANHELLVRCESWNEFVQLYASDISQGGMFTVSDSPVPLLSAIEVQLRLPEGHDITLSASVVHIIDAAQAERENLRAGIGVHFVDLNKEQRQQIQQLIEFARWEGVSGQPSASYASRMFELSTSMQPSQLLEALPKPTSSQPGQPSPADARSPAAGSAPTLPRPNLAGPNVAGAARQTGERSLAPGMPPIPGSTKSMVAGTARSTANEGELGPPRHATSASELDAVRRTARDGELGSIRRTAKEGELGAAQPDAVGAATGSSKAANPAKLKLGMTHLAHKRFEAALKVFEEVLVESPADRLAQQWVHLTRARTQLSKGKPENALEHYQRVVAIDETNLEARMFVREHSSAKRLNSLPFGRYFVKKT